MAKFSNGPVSGIWKEGVTGQGGLFSGVDPTAFGTSDSLRVWIIQMGMIIMMTQLLSLGLSKIRQPKVIAGVLSGILLGPTAMGRIPGFTQHIFPAQSLPHLSVVANIGLCLFLLIVGLEIDTSVIKRKARLSLFVALSAMALSFGLGAAISVPLYYNFVDPSVNLTYFMLFTGVSFSITAFPVLCHILSALKLLNTTVGVIVLSAGACNDVVCWILLALAVPLVATSGLTASWILLTCVAFTVFLMWPVRIALLRFAGFTGSTENGPTISFMIVAAIILLTCAFFAGVVGVNAIFGMFLAGVIVPREGGLANLLAEKLEDMVTIVFLPVYFTLSGLNTDFGLLNNGITWGFTIAIICLDFAGKFGACTITARISGMSWRQSSTVGLLMSCKGPVGLIVLNIGLVAGIFTERVFSMFVLEVLVLAFITTPLVSFLDPPERRRVRALAGGIPRRSTGEREEDMDSRQSPITDDRPWRSRFTVVLDKFDHTSGMLAATQLILPSPLGATSQESEVCVNALRLAEMSDCTSDIMKPSAVDALIHTDPALGVFRTFGELNGIRVSLSLSIVPYEDMSDTISDHAIRYGSKLILLQLPPSPPPISGNTTEDPRGPHSTRIEPISLQAFFGGSTGTDNSAAAVHSQFVRRVLAESKIDVALFIDPGASLSGTDPRSARHIFSPFFGGPDDRLALEFVMQLCDNPNTSATVVRMSRSSAERAVLEWPSIPRPEEEDSYATRRPGYHGMPIQSTVVLPISYGQTRFESERADSILWAQYVDSHSSSDMHPSIRAALSRIRFSEHSSTTPLDSAIHLASTHKPVLVVVGRSPRLQVGPDDHPSELENIPEERGSVGQDDMRKTIGDAATALVASGCASAMVVLHAANASTD